MRVIIHCFSRKCLLTRVLAHRDSGGLVTMAIFRCRKITIAAVNGHAVIKGLTSSRYYTQLTMLDTGRRWCHWTAASL